MSVPLAVRLFGSPTFSVGGRDIVCPSKKSVALIVFLLLTGKPHSRHSLASLLWGRRDEDAARNSLRVALHRLPPELARCLAIDRDAIGVAPGAELLVDATRFEALAQAQSLEDLEAAALLYQDELFKGFDADATPEYDDWMHAQRTRLAQLAQVVFDGVIARRADRARHDHARATSERESAVAIGVRWASLMPGSEAAHRWLMRLYLDMARRDAALAQFELCQRQLAVLHGRTPSPETRALQEAALGESPEDSPSTRSTERTVVAALEGAAVASTSFVGRVEELAALDALMSDAECRLVTLHGLGGSGKTRLAHAFATQVGHRFANGVSWIAAETLDAAEGLARTIADALGRELPARGDRIAALAAMLARQQRLLVIDNFESLLEGDGAARGEASDVVVRLLQAAPQLRILVTSREVLGVQEEWVYDVGGLHFADGDAPATSAEPAVELFAQRARQAYLGFSMAAELRHVRRICRVVEGLPLGIELAAAWVRTIPCADIAAAIEAAAGTLVSPHRNRPHRHGNLEAVVACSWNLLQDEQQQALAGLSVFAGSFSRDQAQRIVDAPLRTLSALVDKSLVRRRTEGRYDLHALVRQFAAARLRSMRSRRASVGKRYRESFAELTGQLGADLRSASEIAADALLRIELPNILGAWHMAIDAGATDIVERMGPTLVAMLHTRGLVTSAVTEAQRAVRALDRSTRNDVITLLRMQWGRAAITAGRQDDARRELESAVALARIGAKPEITARALYYLGAIEYEQGNIDAADALADEALALGAGSEDAELRMLVHNLPGVLANMRARFDVAEALLRKGLDAARELGAPSAIGGMLCGLGVPLYYRGSFDQAAALSSEAADLYETLGRNANAITVRGNLAGILAAKGDLPAAREQAEAAVRLSRDSGNDSDLVSVLATLGDILLRQDQRAPARAKLDECLRLLDVVHRPLVRSEVRFLLASLDLREGDRQGALTQILGLRDVLAAHRLDVRVPMLVIATADYVLAGIGGPRHQAGQWIDAVERQEDADASLRDKARELRLRSVDEQVAQTQLSLEEAEQQVVAYLDGLEGNRRE